MNIAALSRKNAETATAYRPPQQLSPPPGTSVFANPSLVRVVRGPAAELLTSSYEQANVKSEELKDKVAGPALVLANTGAPISRAAASSSASEVLA